MPDERTVLDHLREGRDALAAEVSRLTAAIEELDSVLGRIGSLDRLSGGSPAAEPVQHAATAPPTASAPVAAEPVNPDPEVEPAAPVAVPSRRRTTARKTAKKAASRTRRGEAPKSIRVHVLDMLAAENREFGLAEIIDRVHDAGIQAHDDAVRSITIKLMKDGRVERVGRGQYRLARRGGATTRASAATATTARVTEFAPEAQSDVPAAAAPTDGTDYVSETVPDAPAANSNGNGPGPADRYAGSSSDTLAATEQAAHDSPADDSPADNSPADNSPADNSPAEDSPADDTSARHDLPYGTPAAQQRPYGAPQDNAAEPEAQHDERNGGRDEQGWRSNYTPPSDLGQPWQN